MKVQIYNNIKDTRGKEISINEILERFKNDKTIKKHTDHLRITLAGDHNKDKRNTYKKEHFSMFVPQGTFSQRNKTSIKDPSGLMIIDIDDFHDVNEAEKLKDILKKFNYVYSIFVSPSAGLKVLVKITKTKSDNEYKQIYESIRRDWESITTLDTSGVDICRACFLSHDENLYVNENTETYTHTIYETKKEENKPVEKKEKDHTQIDVKQTDKIDLSPVSNALNKYINSIEGDRYKSLQQCCYLIGGSVAQGHIGLQTAISMVKEVVAKKQPGIDRDQQIRDTIKKGMEKPTIINSRLEKELSKQRTRKEASEILQEETKEKRDAEAEQQSIDYANSFITESDFAHNIVKEECPSIEEVELVERILYKGFITLVKGARETAKTLYAQKICFDATKGNISLGKKTKEFKTLFLDCFENSNIEINKRLKLLEKENDFDYSKIVYKRQLDLKLGQTDKDGCLTPETLLYRKTIENIVKTNKIDVVVIDSISKLSTDSTFGSTEPNLIMDFFRYLVNELNISILLIGHVSKNRRKGAGSTFGSSAWENNCDVIINSSSYQFTDKKDKMVKTIVTFEEEKHRPTGLHEKHKGIIHTGHNNGLVFRATTQQENEEDSEKTKYRIKEEIHKIMFKNKNVVFSEFLKKHSEKSGSKEDIIGNDTKIRRMFNELEEHNLIKKTKVGNKNVYVKGADYENIAQEIESNQCDVEDVDLTSNFADEKREDLFDHIIKNPKNNAIEIEEKFGVEYVKRLQNNGYLLENPKGTYSILE